MPDFSHVIPESHQNVSARVLETLIQAQHETLFTGLMRLNFFPDEDLIFSFLEGKQKKLYRCRDGAVEILSKQDWQEALDGQCHFVGFLPLQTEAMRFIRVTHEAPIHGTDRSTFSSDELATVVEKWVAEGEPGIVHVYSESLNRYYLVPGNSNRILEELSVLEGEARFALNDAAFPKALPQRDYKVVRYMSDHDHDVWREYELRLAFHPFMHMLLNRFSELAGRVLTERLCGQLSAWAREGGWHVTLTGNGIVNRHYFDSVESAIDFYVQLMRRFNVEASPALGPRMTEGISQEILMKLDSHRYKALTRSIFSWLGAGGGAAGDWR